MIIKIDTFKERPRLMLDREVSIRDGLNSIAQACLREGVEYCFGVAPQEGWVTDEQIAKYYQDYLKCQGYNELDVLTGPLSPSNERERNVVTIPRDNLTIPLIDIYAGQGRSVFAVDPNVAFRRIYCSVLGNAVPHDFFNMRTNRFILLGIKIDDQLEKRLIENFSLLLGE